MLERGELASLHQDIPAQGLEACQTALRDASPAIPGVAVIVHTRGALAAQRTVATAIFVNILVLQLITTLYTKYVCGPVILAIV